jgi:hypothetical protein
MKKTLRQFIDDAKHLFHYFIDCVSWFRPTGYESLLKQRLVSQLIDTFSADEGQLANTKTGELGYGLLHYALIRNSKPKRILCIGSRKGFIPAICALACKSNGFGHVDFVDAGYGEGDIGKNWSGVGFWKKINPITHFGALGISPQITTHIMTSRQFANKKNTFTYEYIYIDGDHSYKGVKTDYQLFWPRLKVGGLMVFHDVMARGMLDGGVFGVQAFWKEIQHIHTILFPFPASSGLGIIQK